MRNILIVLLLVVAIVMLYLGGMKAMIPPMLTGVGFILIAIILYIDRNNVAQK
jgi:hypothetical protein